MLCSARLDDSIIENSFDVSLDNAADPSDLFLDKTLFDENIVALDEFISTLLVSLMKNVENKLRPKLAEYASEKWAFYWCGLWFIIFVQGNPAGCNEYIKMRQPETGKAGVSVS